MSLVRYQSILGTFVVIAGVLVVIAAALILLPGKNDTLDFNFPETLSAHYIELLDWPPQVQVVNAEFSCLDAGNATDRAGKTEMREVNGRNFCVTEVVEGAAGTTYTQYAYAFERDHDTVVLTFSTRAPQCGNYPEPEMTACAKERAELSIDKFIANIVDEAD